MAPVILSTVVHCKECGETVARAVKKVAGVKRVTVTVEAGLVAVEGTADPEALRARLYDRVKPVPVTIVSDGKEQGEVVGDSAAGAVVKEDAASSPPRRPAPAPPLVLRMKLHCDCCAGKVKELAMKIPGVKEVTTDVKASRVEVIGTADASTVATTIGVDTKRSVKVISDPGGTGFPGYKQPKKKKKAAAQATAEQEEPNETAAAATEDGNASPVLTPIKLDSRLRIVEPEAPSPPPAQVYGTPAPEAAYYYNPETGGRYGVQHWTAPAPYTSFGGGYYDHRGQGQVYGGDQYMWPTTPYPTPASCYYSYSDGPPGVRVRGQENGDDDENNAGSECTIQ
ncbi:hypothetical protein QOZ80_2AG0125760 [Eleusine coracana subsp. coracana]|nr:hypothetical protein QOZ80_2AG0125760 [Eleusine coracana subsp. coracana]